MKQLEELKTRQGFDYLKKITAVDYADRLEVVYIVYNTESKKEEIVKVTLPSKNPEIDTVLSIYKAADWYEREMSEMFGIRIRDRDAPRLLLEEWNGTEYPLRKAFVWGTGYKKQE